MKFTYAGAANNTTNGIALGASGQDIKVTKLIVGLPVASGNITLYNKAVAFNGDTADIAFKYTHGSDVAPADTSYFEERVFDFGEGLQLDGGNLQIDQAMQVTVLWKLA